MNIFGVFNVILIEPLANGLVLFYKLLFSNMGLAIVGFSLFLRVILNPLTKPYMQSMKKMKEYEPQLNKLKERWKDDKTKLMQAQADFYKEKGINPGAGCLPYILQIIVLIALFSVFSRALSTSNTAVANFNSLLYTPLKFAANQRINTRFLYLDVTRPDSFRIPGVPFPIPGPVLLLAALVQFLSAKMMAPLVKAEEEVAEKSKSGADDIQVAMQSSMTFTFPLFTIIFGLSFPSGLAIYWFLFSFYQMIQQYQTSGWGALSPTIAKLGFWRK